MNPPHVRVVAFDFFEQPMRTRMPFKYGIATLTEIQHLIVRLDVLVDGKRQHGFAADGLAPKWFTKDPQRAV